MHRLIPFWVLYGLEKFSISSLDSLLSAILLRIRVLSSHFSASPPLVYTLHHHTLYSFYKYIDCIPYLFVGFFLEYVFCALFCWNLIAFENADTPSVVITAAYTVCILLFAELCLNHIIMAIYKQMLANQVAHLTFMTYIRISQAERTVTCVWWACLPLSPHLLQHAPNFYIRIVAVCVVSLG